MLKNSSIKFFPNGQKLFEKPSNPLYVIKFRGTWPYRLHIAESTQICANVIDRSNFVPKKGGVKNLDFHVT